MIDFHAPNPAKDYLLVSVQRTGTRFTQRILDNAKIKTAQIHAVDTRAKQLDAWLEQNEMADGVPIVVPLRHPLNVAQSWLHRKDQLDQMFDQWRYLAEIIAKSKPLFLPVDHGERELYLDEMSDYMGVKLWTDWKKYGEKPGAGDVIINKPTVDRLNEMIATTFLQDFYAEVPHGT
jgi:hypothetical protein